jgi:hypothetical protein
MFGRVKKYFGIEGVKVELVIPEEIKERSGQIEGSVIFTSMNTQIVTQVRVKLIERYFRGRGKEKLVDEYQLGEIYLDETFEVPANEPLEVNFQLPFDLVHSDFDTMERKSIFGTGLARLAKYAYSVKSVYRIEAEARVKGTALNPFDKKEIKIK